MVTARKTPSGKLSFMQFVISDWVKDTRILTLEQRGAWIDILCILWESPTRGKKTMKISDWAHYLQVPDDQIVYLFGELKRKSVPTVTFGDGRVTLSSRRMLRDEKVRQLGRMRSQKHRDKTGVTQTERSVTPEKLEVRSYIPPTPCVTDAKNNNGGKPPSEPPLTAKQQREKQERLAAELERVTKSHE